MKKILPVLVAAMLAPAVAIAKNYTLDSPDGALKVEVTAGQGPLTWSITVDGTEALKPSPMGLTLADGRTPGRDARVRRASRRSVDQTFATPHYRTAEVHDAYNELTLAMQGGYSLQLRAWNDAAAYRFVLEGRDSVDVVSEDAEFRFGTDRRAWLPLVNDLRDPAYPYSFSFESYYDVLPLGQMPADTLSAAPVLVELDGTAKALLMEGMLDNYPGMFLRLNDAADGLAAVQAPVPTADRIGGFNRLNLVPTADAGVIARLPGRATLPWRAVAVSRTDGELAASDLAMRLAEPLQLESTDWIVPGKVAWDWWNDWGLTGVDFEAGINTPTYKHYVDFAARNGLQYVIIDEGWSDEDLMDITPALDLPELLQYAADHGIGIILWARWRDLKDDMHTVMPHYAAMGVKGFKVDFFDRDDQQVVASIQQLAQTAADNHLLLDLHGMHPGGWQRPYPNIVNYEGVKGLENYKWGVFGRPGSPDQLGYDVTIPFIRQVAGPMDYTPGAMTNSTAYSYRPSNDAPMSLGTRAHQVAMYVVYDGALQMLADSPSAYDREPDCTAIMAAVPTTFDETRVLLGSVGEYVAMARRKGDTWYVGAMTGRQPRTLDIDTSFLAPGTTYTLEALADGVNAAKHPNDYRISTSTHLAGAPLHLTLAPGGGYVGVFKPVASSK